MVARVGSIGTAVMALVLGKAARRRAPGPGTVRDVAKVAGRDAASFVHASEDDFQYMDEGVALATDTKGRAMGLV